jgi:glycine cleavage system H lipoate-binding protein
MSCPFLREGRARYCHAAPVRKLILDGPGSAGAGRCETAEYRLCPLVQANEAAPVCPHLEAIHVQYCGASGTPKLVPYSEAGLSRCGGSGFRYCELYLSIARPHARQQEPAGLHHATNHLWLDADEGGMCQIGVDSMLAHVAGHVDRVLFVTPSGMARPTVVLTVGDAEWTMVFPNIMRISEVNGHLRQDPSKLSTDPYGAGWLFEGWDVPNRTCAGLLRGAQAAEWLTGEEHRLAEFVHGQLGPDSPCDGGTAAAGVARLLPREQAVRLYHQFFAPELAHERNF